MPRRTWRDRAVGAAVIPLSGLGAYLVDDWAALDGTAGFVVRFVVFGLLGVVLGGVLERLLPTERSDRGEPATDPAPAAPDPARTAFLSPRPGPSTPRASRPARTAPGPGPGGPRR